MKLRTKTQSLLMVLLIGFVHVYTGCAQDAVGLDDLASSETPTNVDNVSGFYVRAKYDPAFPYTTHKGTGVAADDWTESCSIIPGAADNDITCIIEAKELDLYFNGFELEYNVPQGMCDYVEYLPPYYYNFEPGIGPARVVMNSDDIVQEGLNPGEIAIDGVLASEIYCPYDYSDEANPSAPSNGSGPNCCTGSYSYVVYNADGGAQTSSVDWGGKAGNCLQGPAVDINPLSSSGYPQSVYIRTTESGVNDSYVVRAPISWPLGSNYYASNYFVAADHPLSGGVPRAFAAVGGVGSSTNPYHLFVCYDRAEEVLARIRVLVREWNLVSEYENGATGDPDTTTNESGFDNPSNNDRYDFKDLGDAYPEENFSN